jgi:quercetin dioxygenase-like cupin family protein
MSKRNQWWAGAFTVLWILLLAGFAPGQATAGQAMGQNMAEMTFGPLPGLPTCLTGSVQNGDPTKGPSIILAKIAPGCSIPWHWHTPNERLMVVSGEARLEMKDGEPLMLRAGGYAMAPANHVHQFHCDGPCTVYIYADAAFDIHYVDPQGKEISVGEALKPFKETASLGMK